MGEATSESTAKVYPNPSSAGFKLHISGKNTNMVSLIVTDIAGRTIENLLLHAGVNDITFGENYSSGNYFISLPKISGNKTQKLVKF